MTNEEELKVLMKSLADSGRLIEAGWISLRIAALPLDAPEIQVTEMRKAFMAGATHLFGSIISLMDPGEEPTEKDMHRLTLINEELKKFEDELKLELRPKPRRN